MIETLSPWNTIPHGDHGHLSVTEYEVCESVTEYNRGLDTVSAPVPARDPFVEAVRAATAPATGLRDFTSWSEVRSLGNQVPEGRYAVDMGGKLRFYHVDKPTEGRWAGYVFVKVQASDDLHPVKRPDSLISIFRAILIDTTEAMARYGREIGRCGRCGRTLTDEVSRSRGIGPDCWTKL